MNKGNEKEQNKVSSRRRLLKALTGTGGIMATGAVLPKAWVSPVVDSITLPAHAQTSLTVGNFGAAVPALGARADQPSVLDLVVPRAEAVVTSAMVGNVAFEAYWTVRENDALICGTAFALSSSAVADLSGSVPRSGDSLGNFQRTVGAETLRFKNQQVVNGGVSLNASATGQTSPFFAPPGIGCTHNNATSSINSSSPYGDDEELA